MLGLSIASIALVATMAADGDREAFEEQWSDVQRSMERERWSRALDGLEELLTEHREQDYVFQHSIEIQEAYRRCAFLAVTEVPDPQSLISGELVSWNERTGKIHLRYQRGSTADFESVGDIELHPAVFVGQYQIELSGSAYPGRATLVLYAGMHQNEGYAAGFGSKTQASSYIPPRLIEIVDGDQTIVAEKERSQTAPGKPFKAKVVVGKKDIATYYNGRKILSAKRKTENWGRAGFGKHSSIETIELKGEVESAWLQGKVDAALEKSREQFFRTWKDTDHLPAWLLAGPQDAPTREPDEDLLPGRGDPDVIARVLDSLDEGDVLRAEAELETATEDDLEPSLHHYLYSRLHRHQHEPQLALEQLEQCAALAPENPLAQFELAELTADVCGRTEALQRAEAEFQEDDALAGRATRLAQAHLIAGDPQRAKELLDRARSAGAQGATIDRLERTLVKALHGPQWPKTHEYESAHYVVRSDIDRDVCVDAARILEEGYRAYGLRLLRLPNDGRKFPVYLFSGESGYQHYVADVFESRAENTAGMYHQRLRQLLIWNLPDRDQMMQTVRHEGFHQYLDRALDDVPRWFNEGLAEYYEISGMFAAKWEEGQVHPLHELVLHRPGTHLVPLDEFLAFGPAQFYSNAPLHYAQAWAFVHYLRHGRKDDLIEELLKHFQETPRGRAEAVFADHNLVQMDEEFLRYVATELRSR